MIAEHELAINKLVAAGASHKSAVELCARLSSPVFCRGVDALIKFMNENRRFCQRCQSECIVETGS